ncbi:PEP/pyruvate-binding domain-containing protein [Kribbella solani]|uniref:PEP/pyruvate-binding domain-containing protein n=1 Tax=Kribbella solani TaxID=236067 RepID=UPI0029B6F6F1|nr:PEP/pyruvate-binding domain-containing protein [Kribbella solani]MDX2968432.1 PEP/pyruvate-binding domain-containing protein [Kribbella solani]
MSGEYIVRLNDDVDPDEAKAALDPARVGLKVAWLAELAQQGVRVPAGFAVTASAYREFIVDSRLGPVIAQAIRRFRAGRDLVVAAAEIRTAFRDAWLPPVVVDEIVAAYAELGGDGTDVAVRCCPRTAAEGVQDEVFLHLTTVQGVLAACRRCFASLYGTVAVGNREALGVDQLRVAMPVVVQPMVRSGLGGSGTARGESTFVRVRASWGIGSHADSDLYSVHPGARPLVVRHRGAKLTKTVYADPRGTRTVPTTPAERAGLVLTDEELQELARWPVVADEHFRHPMTLEWAKDGQTGSLYVVEVRPGVAAEVMIQARGSSVPEPQYG